MKLFSSFILLLSIGLLSPNAVCGKSISSEEIPFTNDYDCYIYTPIKIKTLDNEILKSAENKAKVLVQSIDKEIRILESDSSKWDRNIKSNKIDIYLINKFISYSKKIDDQNDKVLLDSLVCKLVSGNKDVYKKILKDASKGKLSDELVLFLNESKYNLARSNDNILNQKQNEERKLRNSKDVLSLLLEKIGRFKDKEMSSSNNDKVPSSTLFGKDEIKLLGNSLPGYIPIKEIERSQKNKNPWKRKLDVSYSQNDYIDKKTQTEGWEWIENENDFKEETLYYPNKVTYKVYSSHPDIRIVKDCAFDAEGNLLRVLSFTKEGMFEKDIDALESKLSEMLNLLLIVKDYKDNKYGIKEAGADVVYAVENLIGISNEFKKAEEKRLKPYVSQMENALKSGNVRLYNQLRDKYAVIIYGPKPKDPNNNEKAKNFINQCKSDHAKDKIRIWKIDRLSDTSFKVIFLNAANSATREISLTFGNEAPYGIKIVNPKSDTSGFAEQKSFDSSLYQMDCE